MNIPIPTSMYKSVSTKSVECTKLFQLKLEFNSDASFQRTALNVAHNPCVDDVNYTIQNCELECFSEVIARHANCCLPFMSLSRTSSNYKNCAMCNTPDDYYRADAELQRMLRNSTPWVGTWRNNFLVFPFSENSTKRSVTARVSTF